MTVAQRQACIVGVGHTNFTKDSGRSTTRLAFEAISAACGDAGVEPAVIDGIVPFMQGPTAEDIMGVFALPDITFTAVPHMGGAGSVAALRAAALAVETGRANWVIAYVSRNGRSGREGDKQGVDLRAQPYRQQLEWVNGMNTPAQWYALMARRHMHEFGTSRQALGTVALTMRANAQRNPNAMMRGKNLTMEEYLASRPIAEPYHLFDCCLETDGAAAVLITSTDRARGLGPSVVRIAGSAEGYPAPADDIANRPNFFDIGLTRAAPRAFREAGLTPTDVDVAFIYDCFTFEVIQQLEEAGFCKRGEGGPFVLDGAIAANGRLPVNPHGGLLSEGHIAGMNHVVEAVRQLRHEADERQVDGAEVGVVTGWGHMGHGSIAVLVRE